MPACELSAVPSGDGVEHLLPAGRASRNPRDLSSPWHGPAVEDLEAEHALEQRRAVLAEHADQRRGRS
jgi:hypothetical protein